MVTATRLATYRLDVGTVELFVSDCASCGVVFGMSSDLEQRRRDDGKSFYCPNGHTMWFGKDRATREKDRADRAERERDAARDQADAAERSARAYRGHVTRLRNRIAAGVCPVTGCRRNFSNVKAHVQTQHPQWAHDHPEALA